MIRITATTSPPTIAVVLSEAEGGSVIHGSVIDGSGVGSGLGSGLGSGVGSGVGSGLGSGVGSGVGSGLGSGLGSGVGSGVGVSEGEEMVAGSEGDIITHTILSSRHITYTIVISGTVVSVLCSVLEDRVGSPYH